MLVQSTSNIVTMNERLASQLWATYMALTDEENILMSALASVPLSTMFSPYTIQTAYCH
jgi:hypothetical protein